MSGPYRRVPAEELHQNHQNRPSYASGGGEVSSTAEGRHHASNVASSSSTATTRTAAERVSDKLHALLWIGAAVAVAKYSNFFGVMLHDSRVLRPVFNAAVAILGVNTTLTLYLAVYLPRVVGIKDPSAWEAYCPRVIPTITALGIACGFLLIRSLWPIWGVLTPLVLGVESLGALFSLHFLPWL